MQTLLIFEMNPESVSLYLIPNSDMDEEAEATCRLAQGHFGNGSKNTKEQDQAIEKINNAICENPEYLGPDYPAGSRWGGTWAKYKTEGEINANITRVFHTGFIL